MYIICVIVYKVNLLSKKISGDISRLVEDLWKTSPDYQSSVSYINSIALRVFFTF